jgi:hypothetical protein
MKIIMVLFLILLAGMMLFPQMALAAPDSRYVRIDIGNIQANTEVSGSMLASLNDVSQTLPVTLAIGDNLQTSFLFPLVNPATWSVNLSSQDGKVLMALEGNLSVSDNSVNYSVTSASLESGSLSLQPDVPAFSLVVGRVSGSLEASVDFVANTDAVISLGIDTDGDGKVDGSEITQQEIKSTSADLATPALDSIPLTAQYNVDVEVNGTTVAKSTGSYDFVKGQSVQSTKYIDPQTVTQLSVTYNRVPYVATVAMPNSIFKLPGGTMQTEAQSQESTVDIIKSSSANATPIAVKSAGTIVSSAGDTWGQISNFLGRYWPYLAIAGAVFVGMLLLLKLVFQLR